MIFIDKLRTFDLVMTFVSNWNMANLELLSDASYVWTMCHALGAISFQHGVSIRSVFMSTS